MLYFFFWVCFVSAYIRNFYMCLTCNRNLNRDIEIEILYLNTFIFNLKK